MGRVIRRMTQAGGEWGEFHAKGPPPDATPPEPPPPHPEPMLIAVLAAYERARRQREYVLNGKASYVGPDPASIGANNDANVEESITLKCFRALAALLEAKEHLPTAYIARRFSVHKSDRMVQPNQLLSHNGLKGGALVDDLMSSPSFRQDLAMRLASQREAAKTALALAPDNDVRCVICDKMLSLSPLFRWVLARAVRCEYMLRELFPKARAQYRLAPHDYVAVWGDLLDPEICEELDRD